ncbi:MAG: isoprenoid biosynthesis glyoxalase ElbB [Planctomycetes bacterium]|nr:isoprenoid biosynthesis glyoxalase ElbB [Planctomycetota bacterium]
MKKVAVVLCGAGRFDGSEIHESVLTFLHLSRAGAEVQAFAPDEPQWAVCEHFKGQPQAGESRNQLAESARIARGLVLPLSAADGKNFDALILPGGSGAAHNLCNFATAGANGDVIPDLQQLIHSFIQAGKPIGAICIAPAIVALALKGLMPQLTLGAIHEGPAVEAAKTGAQMVKCAVDEIHVDTKNQIVSTPAYILGPDIAAVDQGIGKLVAQVLELCC